MNEKRCVEHCEKCYEVGGYFYCSVKEQSGHNDTTVDETDEVPQVCIKRKDFVERDTKTPALF